MSGFIQIRSGIEEHLAQGRLSCFDLGIYTLIQLQVDKQSGVWWGSASRLSASAPRGSDLRQIQRAMQQLEAIQFIRTFRTRGATGNYPVLVHKYEPLFGALRGRRLDAWKSTDWKHLYYEPCAAGAVPARGARGAAAPGKEEKLGFENREENLEPSPPTPRSGGAARELWLAYEKFRGALPQCKALSRERERKCAGRWRDHQHAWAAFLASWSCAVEKAGKHPWPNWRPHFDYFVANDTNWRQVEEGQFDNWKEQPKATPSPAAAVAPAGKYANVKPAASG